MVTLATELSRALIAAGSGDSWTVFASRERPDALADAPARFLLSPHRHELANKLAWLPSVEAGAALDAVLYPYWPPPPRRRPQAPPATFFVHDLAFRLRPDEVPWQQRAYLGSLLPGALAAAHAVVCPSSTTAADLLACYPLRGLEARVRVVPEGPSELGPPGELPAGLSPGFILAVGTVERRKNYGRLAAAYRRLASPPPLVVAGGRGWERGGDWEVLRRTDGVILLGHVSDGTLRRLYREAAVFAFVSLYEGFGLPLLDALQEGVPALVSNAGALPELAGGAAWLVEPADPDAIAAGLERLLGDAALREHLAAAGRLRGREFSWERAAREVREVLAGG